MTAKDSIPLKYWVALVVVLVAGGIIALALFPGFFDGQAKPTVHPSPSHNASISSTPRPSPSLHVSPHNGSVSSTPLPPIPSPHPTVTYRPTAPFNSPKPTVRPSPTPTAKPTVNHPATPVPTL